MPKRMTPEEKAAHARGACLILQGISQGLPEYAATIAYALEVMRKHEREQVTRACVDALHVDAFARGYSEAGAAAYVKANKRKAAKMVTAELNARQESSNV